MIRETSLLDKVGIGVDTNMSRVVTTGTAECNLSLSSMQNYGIVYSGANSQVAAFQISQLITAA